MNQRIPYNICSCEVYLILETNHQPLPDVREDTLRREWVQKIAKAFPYLVNKEKRALDNQRLTLYQRVRRGSLYSFQNKGKQQGVEWIDYKIKVMPLLMALFRVIGDTTFEEVINSCCLKREDSFKEQTGHCDIEIRWQHVIDIIERNNKCDFLQLINASDTVMSLVDQIDRYYDEIKITHLQPEAYHQLFAWFGDAIVEVGYRAFDIFVAARDGEVAWQKAIKEHVDEYQFDQELHNEILTNELYPLLKFI